MSVSGSRAAVDLDLEDFEKRLRAAATPSGGVEDPLSELTRLVEASRPKAPAAEIVAPVRPVFAAPARPVADETPRPAPPDPPTPSPPQAPRPLEADALRPAVDEATDREPESAEAVDVADEAEADPAFETDPANGSAPPPARRRPRRWGLTVASLVVAGVAMIGAVLWLRGGLPGAPKAPPFISAAQGPTKVLPPSDATVSASNDAGANLLKDNTLPNHVKIVSSEEQPVDLNAQTAPPPAPAQSAPAPAQSPPAPAPALAPTTSVESDSATAPAVRGSVDTPLVLPPPLPAPAAPPFPEAKPVRTISLRPDGTPIPTSGVDAATSQAPPPSQPVQPAPEPPRLQPKSVAKAPPDATGAQPSTPKIELPTKLSGKSSARVVVAKTDTTAPGGAAEAPGEAVPLGGAAKAEKPAKPKTQQAAAEPAAPATAPAETAATSSGGWAVQLAAPRSEEEAQGVVAKLKEKYASALGGAALGVHKATVNGDTIYRVRVTGLSKADAAALCARLKGDGGQCFVAR